MSAKRPAKTKKGPGWSSSFMKNTPPKPPPEKCQFCGLNPKLKANKGRQIYVCDKCEALVCSDCSLDGPSKVINEVLCKTCDYELQLELAEQNEGKLERKPDRCSRCDAIISATRAARFSVCSTCDPSTSDNP